jgi:adenylate kinase
MNIVIFGIQGSGKGTQAQLLVKKYHLALFEAGAECRRLASEDSELGRKVKEIIDGGDLVPSNVIIEILDAFLSKVPATQNVIFDGIPRNPDQQVEFDRILKKWNRDFIALNIELPEEETIKRLLARGRHDDKPEIITNRIKIFVRDTAPIIEAYRAQNKIININGNQSIEQVDLEINNKLAPYLNK